MNADVPASRLGDSMERVVDSMERIPDNGSLLTGRQTSTTSPENTVPEEQRWTTAGTA